MKLRLVLGLFAILPLLVPGRAEAGKFYVGGSLAQSSIDMGAASLDDGSFTFSTVDDTDKGYKVFAGFKMFKFLALEVDQLDAGEVVIDATSDGSGLAYVAGPVHATTDIDGLRFSALAKLPVGKRFSIFARFGYFEWDSKSSLSNGGTAVRDSAGGTDSFYGAGVSWKFIAGTSLRAEYETMTLDSTDVDIYSVGVAFGF